MKGPYPYSAEHISLNRVLMDTSLKTSYNGITEFISIKNGYKVTDDLNRLSFGTLLMFSGVKVHRYLCE